MSLSTEAVWTTFREPLRSYVARRVPEPADADDVLQEVFVRVMRYGDSAREEKIPLAWLSELIKK